MNDNIAFRTFNHRHIGIDILAKSFVKAGYEPRGENHFEEKKLFARHFEHKSIKTASRVFISELLTENFSEFLRETVTKWIDSIPEQLQKSDELLFAGTSWTIPSWEVYNRLREESEYAGWLYVNGFRANHFTVSINSLKKYNTIEKVNQFIKDNGFRMNSSGGEIMVHRRNFCSKAAPCQKPFRFVLSKVFMKFPGVIMNLQFVILTVTVSCTVDLLQNLLTRFLKVMISKKNNYKGYPVNWQTIKNKIVYLQESSRGKWPPTLPKAN